MWQTSANTDKVFFGWRWWEATTSFRGFILKLDLLCAHWWHFCNNIKSRTKTWKNVSFYCNKVPNIYKELCVQLHLKILSVLPSIGLKLWRLEPSFSAIFLSIISGSDNAVVVHSLLVIQRFYFCNMNSLEIVDMRLELQKIDMASADSWSSGDFSSSVFFIPKCITQSKQRRGKGWA